MSEERDYLQEISDKALNLRALIKSVERRSLADAADSGANDLGEELHTELKQLCADYFQDVQTDPFKGVPDWVTAIATDEDGKVWMYEKKPRIGHSQWIAVDGSSCECFSAKLFSNWKNTLIERKP